MADPLTLGFMALGAVVDTVSALGEGKAAKDEADFEAEQLEAKAKEETAEASHAAAEEDRQRRLKLSRARAVAGASGSDRAFDLEGEIEEEGQYRALSALFQGENRASGYRNQARGARYSGEVARRAGYINAAGAAIRGASGIAKSKASKSLLEKYGS